MEKLIVGLKLGAYANGSVLENEAIDRTIASEAMKYIRSSDNIDEKRAIAEAAEIARGINNFNLVTLCN